ncbi:MAG: ferredoxin reductase [Solirubrobacteraceae bacterium]
MPVTTATRRLLRSPLVDLLVGPHGIDRYLELIRPEMTVNEARAEVVSVRRQTPRSVTLRLRPNAVWGGFRAGQFVRVGIEIDGVRRTRTYSPACSEHSGRVDGVSPAELELTVTEHPEGYVSRHLVDHARPGTIVHLGQASGEFVLPRRRPEQLILIGGGSGITPVMSMLRTLCEEGHGGQVAFLHYARTAADWLYRSEVQALAARHPNLRIAYLATREGGSHLSTSSLEGICPDLQPGVAHAAVCGPPSLIEATRKLWQGAPERVTSETFTPARLTVTGEAATGAVRFLDSRLEVAIGAGTLLEQAEAAGLSPDFGCRMGICHTCTCRKAAGTVRNVLTGELSAEEDEDIQLCISVPAGDVALEI